jgi:hypothetical protein
MPPQQPDGLLDVIDDGLDFRAHSKSRGTSRLQDMSMTM